MPLDTHFPRVYTPYVSNSFKHLIKGVMMVTDESLLSIPQVAKTLGVTSTIVYRLIDRGTLQPARTEQRGEQVRRFFRASDVLALKRQREGEAEDV